jgi:hypothetical protein
MLSKVTMLCKSYRSPKRVTLSHLLTGTTLELESIVHFYSINRKEFAFERERERETIRAGIPLNFALDLLDLLESKILSDEESFLSNLALKAFGLP